MRSRTFSPLRMLLLRPLLLPQRPLCSQLTPLQQLLLVQSHTTPLLLILQGLLPPHASTSPPRADAAGQTERQGTICGEDFEEEGTRLCVDVGCARGSDWPFCVSLIYSRWARQGGR